MAILNFEKGIAKDSLNWNLYLNYGNALAMDNQDEKCIKALKKSISINSNNKQAYYFLALIYNKLNDKENESKYFDLYSKM
jgi:predicted Zn-dependent protease